MDNILPIYWLLTFTNTLIISAALLKTTCEPIVTENRKCLGEVLSYRFTSTHFAKDSNSQKEIHKNLKLWEGLKFLPKCWSVLQPLLCQVYVPKCENSTVVPPCREQCLATRKPCSVVERYKEWPEFLKCERFPEKTCNGTVSFVTNISKTLFLKLNNLFLVGLNISNFYLLLC